MQPIVVGIADWRGRIWDWANRCVASYQAGRKPRSQAIAIGMAREYGAARIDLDPRVQALGRGGEVGYCLAYGLDPLNELDWSDSSDSGHDLKRAGKTWDVKASELGRRYLIWPVGKRAFFDSGCADMLVLALVGDGRAELIGQVTKERFRREHKTAPDMPAGNRLYAGTWYMDRDTLDPLDDCGVEKQLSRLAHTQEKAGAAPAAAPKFDNDHKCQCGRYGGFGKDDFMAGTTTWYCREHWKG